MRRALGLLLLLAAALAGARAVRADHDDGDDVKEYRYVLRFDAKELAPFAGFIVVDGSDYDQRFEAGRTIGTVQAGSASAQEIAIGWADAVPATIEAIPGPDLLSRVEGWIRTQASGSEDGILWYEPEVLTRFEAAFGSDVHRLAYARSPLMGKLLALAPCRAHFLEAPKDTLRSVREHVTLRYTAPRTARIVTTKYALEYEDGTKAELSPERAAALTPSECRALLHPKRAKGTKASGSHPSPAGLWHVAAPSLAAVALAGLAVRRRRGGA